MDLEHLRLILAEARKVSHHTEYLIAGSLSVLGVKADIPDAMSLSIDVDFYPLQDPGRAGEIARTLGEGSEFHAKYGYYLDPIHPELPTLPRSWRSRIVSHDFGDVTAVFLDVNDTAVSKYTRGAENDLRWIEAGYDAKILDLGAITARAERDTDFYDDEKQLTLHRIQMHRLSMLPDGTLSRPLLQYLKEHPSLDYTGVDTDAGHYTGSILWSDGHHAVQNLGRNQIAIHEVARLDSPPQAYQQFSIRYSGGTATVTPPQKLTQGRTLRPR
ncbi:DUF6036 family nucleotidyltransferase [Burkholderia sp. LMG 13014]|uniref:DUF6036 family nucleotidyltransferase n=1 Tax=Burkholderia sp. LMG 13014 TaxID=2709306 RepID=UPI001962B214|nr:DUF6036 family nucleotidyltransferase [Burkholderia sp. LMG 13014]